MFDQDQKRRNLPTSNPTPNPTLTLGALYQWSKLYSENWSAFAPDFKELEENEEYEARSYA